MLLAKATPEVELAAWTFPGVSLQFCQDTFGALPRAPKAVRTDTVPLTRTPVSPCYHFSTNCSLSSQGAELVGATSPVPVLSCGRP